MQTEPLTLRLHPARVKLAWACGHMDFWPVKLAECKGAVIASRECPECRLMENKAGHLGTGRFYMGEGKPTWGPGEYIPWLPADDARQPKWLPMPEIKPIDMGPLNEARETLKRLGITSETP